MLFLLLEGFLRGLCLRFSADCSFGIQSAKQNGAQLSWGIFLRFSLGVVWRDCGLLFLVLGKQLTFLCFASLLIRLSIGFVAVKWRIGITR